MRRSARPRSRRSNAADARLHARFVRVVAIAGILYLPIVVVVIAAESTVGGRWLGAALLGIVALSHGLAHVLGRRPWYVDLAVVVALGSVVAVLGHHEAFDFAYVISAVYAALYHPLLRTQLLLFGAYGGSAAAGLAIDGHGVVDMVTVLAQIAVGLGLAWQLGHLGRLADRRLAHKRILAAAGVDLAAVTQTTQAANVTVDAARALVSGDGDCQILLTIGDERIQVVTAYAGVTAAVADTALEFDRLTGGAGEYAGDDTSAVGLDGSAPIVLGAAELAELRRSLPLRPVRSGVVMPLATRDRVRGALLVFGDDPLGDGRSWVLATLAGQAALTLDSLEATDQVRRRERWLRTLLSGSTDVVSVIDEEFVVRYASPSCRQLGWAADEIIGCNASFLVHPEDQPAANRALSSLLAKPAGTTLFEWRAHHRDGSWRHVETVATNLLDDPDVGGLLLNSRDVTERKALEQQLAHQALHDPLTGLANRTLFEDRVTQALRRSARSAQPPAVMFVDLDNFKAVNDSQGHAAGDRLLVAIGAALRSVARDHDTVARLSGDEFAVLAEVAGTDDALEVAERLVTTIAAVTSADARTARVTASVGVAVARPEWSTDELLQAADMAMYVVKGSGKGRASVFSDAMTLPSEHVRLVADLSGAVERGELTVHYQPLVELTSGRVVAAEALLRWDHPERGPVPPGVFVPAAERSGLLVHLGAFVLQRAVCQLAEWRRRYPGVALERVAVNLSAAELADPDTAQRIAQVLDAAGLEPHRLTIEVTETTLIAEPALAAQQLAQLKALGVRLAVDDFGAGYAGFGYLRDLPLVELKIDRSYIGGLDGSPVGYRLVSSMLELARGLELAIVAEGVERSEQVGMLRELGAQVAQGFHFARPADASTIEALLAPALPSELAIPQ